MTREDIQQALHRVREDERAADRYVDGGDEAAYATAATVCAEWQRVRDHTVETGAQRYDPDHDTALRHTMRRERHRQDVAECAREAAHQAQQTTDLRLPPGETAVVSVPAHRRLWPGTLTSSDPDRRI
ncbi:hypothetical protein ACFC58_29125 [Kitasatospora purpeofusca]|uniref:hypothetical protein n=1 Tax=Kitasatospora purpeofusca TaxID=67352 RepID=UPI0035DFD30F